MRIAITLALATTAFGCQIVDGDRILGKDLAAANPALTALDPDLVIGPAPLPGVQRIFHISELLRVARQNGISLPEVGELCIERSTELLTPEKLLPVLRAALGIEDAHMEIIDFSRYPIPRGSLEFRSSGLAADGLWRGRVNFGDHRSAPIWARVRVTTEQTWVEAADALPAGKPIDPAALRIGHGPRFPSRVAPLDSVDLAAGRAPVRAIKPGEVIFASMLAVPRQVERGDTVTVEVSSGSARLSFSGVSESPGGTGDLILIRNPENSHLFQARVDGKGKVSVSK